MGRTRSGSIVKRGKRLYARIRWTDSNGNRCEDLQRAQNKTLAREAITRMLADIDGGFGRSTPNISLADFTREFKTSNLKPAEYRDNKKISGRRSLRGLTSFIDAMIEHFGKRRVRDIRYSDLQSYRQSRLGDNHLPRQTAYDRICES